MTRMVAGVRGEMVMPHALTFFLTPEERRRVLGALKRRHADRARALCMALKIDGAGRVKKGDAR